MCKYLTIKQLLLHMNIILIYEPAVVSSVVHVELIPEEAVQEAICDQSNGQIVLT